MDAIYLLVTAVGAGHQLSQPDHNTRIIGGHDDAIEELAVIRQETDGDIGIGGTNLATQLLRAHLLDELLLFTHPVVLGAGRPLFEALDQPLELDLMEQRSFDQGVTMHRYSVRVSASVFPALSVACSGGRGRHPHKVPSPE